MKPIFKRLPVILAVLVTITLMAADPTRERKLQQAIDLLETKGDTRKAIPLLEDVSKSSDRPLAARGLLYLGQAQEREGGDRARATYQRIVSDYATSTELANEARRRLSGLGGPPEQLSFIPLPYPRQYQYDNLSMDGQWLGGTDWDTGDLIIQNVRTGEVRHLASGTADNTKFAESPVPSPDGRQFAYYWQDDAVGDELRVVTSERGATPRTILREGKYASFWPIAWSADGRSVLVSMERPRRVGFDAAWVSVADGAIRVIKSFEGWTSEGANMIFLALSPDRKYIAYKTPLSEGSTERSVHIMSADGTSDTVAVSGVGKSSNPVWTTDGTRILYASDVGKTGIWSAPISAGKRSAAPTIVRPDTGDVRLLGATASGSLLAEHRVGLDEVLVVEMEQNGSRLRSSKPVDRFLGINPTWSRDGKWLGFKRQRANPEDGYDLVLYSTQTTQLRTFQTKMGDGKPQWYNDGSVQPIGNSPYRVSTVGEQPKPLQAERVIPFGNLSSDGKRLFRPAHRDPKNTDTSNPEGIETLDTATGERIGYIDVPIHSSDLRAVPSPDGKLLALEGRAQGPHALGVINIDGSGYRRLTGSQGKRGGVRATVAWSLDGRYLLYIHPDDKLMRIAVTGGTPEPLGIPDQPVALELSPDGTRLAYWARPTTWELLELKNIASTWVNR